MRPSARTRDYAILGGMAGTAAALVLAAGALGLYDGAYAWRIAPRLATGMIVTIEFVVLIIPIGFAMGLLVGFARTSPAWFPRAAGTAYVEFFRGMPPLVLIVFGSLSVATVLRRYFYVEDPFTIALGVGMLALAMHSGGYQAEIVRAGILSVPRGQIEASYALGMTRVQTLFAVILPQAFRVSLPSLGNEFASVIKDTSLLSAISALELAQTGYNLGIQSLPLDPNLIFIVWTEVALLYLVLTLLVTRVVRAVENRVKVPGLEAARL